VKTPPISEMQKTAGVQILQVKNLEIQHQADLAMQTTPPKPTLLSVP